MAFSFFMPFTLLNGKKKHYFIFKTTQECLVLKKNHPSDGFFGDEVVNPWARVIIDVGD
mgnify:CR=1 FL=1